MNIKNCVIKVIGSKPEEQWRYYRQSECSYSDPDELINENDILFWNFVVNYWTVGEGKLKIDAMLPFLHTSNASEELIMSEVLRLIQEKQHYEDII